MTIRHQSSSALQALSGTDRSLRLAGALALQARTGGWLQVQCGQVWITRSGDGLDHVLSAGQRLRLSRGERVVVEPWQAGQAARLAWGAGAAGPQGAAGADQGWRAGGLRVLARGLRVAAGRLSAAARSAEARARRAQGSMAAGDSMASSGAVQ